MKKTILFAFIPTLILSACSSDEPGQPAQDGQVAARIIAGVDGPKSRANGNLWEADQIGVTVTNAPTSDMASRYTNVLHATTSTTDVAAFESETPIYFQDADETVTFSAYAPYSQTLTNNIIEFDITAQSTRNAQKAIDFIFAEGAMANRANPTVSFSGEHKFNHRMARLVVTVKPGQGFTLDDIKGGNHIVSAMPTEGRFNVLTGVAYVIEGTEFHDFMLANAIRTDAADAITYSAIVIPQDWATSHPFFAKIGDQVYRSTSDIPSHFEAGKSYSYTFTVNKTGIVLEASQITDWDNQPNVDGEATM